MSREDLLAAADALRSMPGSLAGRDVDDAMAGLLEWVHDHWVVPRDVQHYTARHQLQQHAVTVAEAVLRLAEGDER